MPHVLPIRTPPIVLGDSLLGIRSLVEPVNPLQIEEVKTSPIDVRRPEMPLETTTVSIPDFALPDMHIQTTEEQKSQESWISLIIDDDEPKFWLNALETLEETDFIPSELEIWICLKTHVATELAIAHGKENQQNKMVKEIVPKELHDFLDIFSDKKATRFPARRPYDHKIETKPGFKPKRHKLYCRIPEKDTALKIFVDKNLQKAYIRPSTAKMASSFFFVKKKTGDK